ncbi:DUF3247 family protein [Dokdonella fugitiva]|uniref:DUF3247 family protein n=1 Tax=Dokdonella fugitiva TaxID=328517 RepID=UPI0015F9886C|nr:DUF3247 family protein [Dokdonella fugitiva]MBA8883317.1 hypothetical protein [Dokdonella fugitiva]
MGRFAATVCMRPEDIERLEHLVTLLPSDARVCVTGNDGQRITGTVVERPAPQLFEDAAGNEGFNAVVRIDDPAAPPWTAHVWLSDIGDVDRLID